MVTPIDGAKFFLDLAKAIVGWSSAQKKLEQEDAARIAEYIGNIATELSEYANILQSNPDDARQQAIERRYYLEMSLNNMAYVMKDHVNEKLLKNLLDRLSDIKVSDGELVPEVSELVDTTYEISSERKTILIENIFRASGEFRAASKIISTGLL